MNKDTLKRIILDQKEVFASKEDLIDRDIALDTYINTSQVVVITGVRRCGKSSLMHLIMKKMQLEPVNYCYFNFDDERIINADFTILEDIDNLHKEIYDINPVLFFDEIQNIKGWEKFINRKYEQGRKIFVTGSNASLLSSEISSSLTGRNRTLSLMPFSFKEYLRLKGRSFNIDRMTTEDNIEMIRLYNVFSKIGGFPLVLKENDLEILDDYFKDILYRDVIARYRISHIDELKQIAQYFFTNVSKLFSYATLQKISGIKSSSSVKNYLDYFNSAYLFYYLRKYDYSIKKQILNNRKVFSIDQGMVNRLGFGFSEDKGRILENIVFLELLRRGKDIFYYADSGECDFLIKNGINISEAIQVVYSLNKQNLHREIKGLRSAMNEFKLDRGHLIYYDAEELSDHISEHIIMVPIWIWLLQNWFFRASPDDT